MAIRLSIIIPIDNAPLSELTMPLASLNSQLGIDGKTVEVLLVDNGEFHLEDTAALHLFAQLHLRVLTTPKTCGHMGALAFGLTVAKGQYVMLLNANNQLYQPFTLQQLLGLLTQHPDTDLLGGTTLWQGQTSRRQPVYRAGQSLTSLAGWLIRRAALSSNAVTLSDDFGEFSEELAARLLRAAVGGTVTTEATVCVVFASRTHPVRGTQPVINEQWVSMMAAFLATLKAQNPAQLDHAFAQFIVRFYSQILRVPADSRAPLTTQVAGIVRDHAGSWLAVTALVDREKVADSSPAAPWNENPGEFNHYLNQLANIAAKEIAMRR